MVKCGWDGDDFINQSSYKTMTDTYNLGTIINLLFEEKKKLIGMLVTKVAKKGYIVYYYIAFCCIQVYTNSKTNNKKLL